MNQTTSRREFLADVGRGMLVASLGAAVSSELGLARVFADDAGTLNFGTLEPLVAMMQETPIAKFLPALAAKLKEGTELRTLIAAGALANARSFGGQDYTGYHALMALMPAFDMSKQLSGIEGALPVFKVLYRNTNRIQEAGGRKNEVLHQIIAAEMAREQATGETLLDAEHKGDMAAAEGIFARMLSGPEGEAFNHLQFAVQDEVDVHRVVLAWRSWALLDVAGKENALTLLRQSLRYCVNQEKYLRDNKMSPSPIRALVPKLFDQYKLESQPLGTKPADDALVAQLTEIIYGIDRAKAADAVAAALADGISPEGVGEAISLAANQLVLRDPGLAKNNGPKRPMGSVHGASVGVHASDSANAWRHIARVSNPRNTYASLIVGAFHTAGQSAGLNAKPYPLAENLEKIEAKDSATLLKDLDAAIKEKDQARASALVQRYGEQGHPERAVLDVMIKYAVSEDGALHAEKFYRTVEEEFAATRAAFRWRHVCALARVTASEYGFPAAGYAEARTLLGA
ncbi:MAG TPA: hypothetical protein VKX17_20395 [Planctomycetota bacterium]|nr:hypothetical protein [Planctomycetota bacterium]